MQDFLLNASLLLSHKQKTNSGLSNIIIVFSVFQKEARHQEVKDSESKEDERSRKQYPFTLIFLLLFMKDKSFHYLFFFVLYCGTSY